MQEEHRGAWSAAVNNEAVVADDMVPRNSGRPRGAEAGLCFVLLAFVVSHLSNPKMGPLILNSAGVPFSFTPKTRKWALGLILFFLTVPHMLENTM